MTRFVEFVKTTTLGGLVAIVPLAVVGFVLWSILSVLIELTEALKDVLPFAPWLNTLIVLSVAALLLLVLCFGAGLTLRTALGNRTKDWIEKWIDKAIPLYGMARGLAERVAGVDGTEFIPAEIDLWGGDVKTLGVVTEMLPDDRCAVFAPIVPTATFGQLYVLPRSRVRKLDAPMTDAMAAITQFGVGTEKLYGGERQEPESRGES